VFRGLVRRGHRDYHCHPHEQASDFERMCLSGKKLARLRIIYFLSDCLSGEKLACFRKLLCLSEMKSYNVLSKYCVCQESSSP
jgi:hypothetical protein